MDLCGPMQHAAFGDKRYFMINIDDFIRKLAAEGYSYVEGVGYEETVSPTIGVCFKWMSNLPS